MTAIIHSFRNIISNVTARYLIGNGGNCPMMANAYFSKKKRINKINKKVFTLFFDYQKTKCFEEIEIIQFLLQRNCCVIL